VRGAVGVSDRGHTAISKVGKSDFNWERVMKEEGARWLHTGGIFAALSEQSAEVAYQAALEAKQNGTIVSYDLNYRPSLWKDFGGKERAQQVNQRIAKEVDVIFGNEEDFEVALGIEMEDSESDYRSLNNLQVIAVTLRTVKSASINDWSALAWSRDSGFVTGRTYENLEIFDRVGGGDSFASGFIYGALQGFALDKSLEFGLAHGALAMTTPGDTSMASLDEVKKLAEGGSARVQR